MTRDGLVRAAAIGSDGFVRYTHRFPGTHSQSQVEGAVQLELEPGRMPKGANRRLAFLVSVDNRKSGHRLPTGSSDLRVLWLEVGVRAGDRLLPVAAAGKDAGVAGLWKDDAQLLGKDVAPGSRIYRAIFVDANGRQTLHSWEATRIAFDNRLPAGSIVKEAYALDLPADFSGPLEVEARLRYLAYPSSFAALMDLAPSPVVDVAMMKVDLPPAP